MINSNIAAQTWSFNFGEFFV